MITVILASDPEIKNNANIIKRGNNQKWESFSIWFIISFNYLPVYDFQDDYNWQCPHEKINAFFPESKFNVIVTKFEINTIPCVNSINFLLEQNYLEIENLEAMNQQEVCRAYPNYNICSQQLTLHHRSRYSSHSVQN